MKTITQGPPASNPSQQNVSPTTMSRSEILRVATRGVVNQQWHSLMDEPCPRERDRSNWLNRKVDAMSAMLVMIG